MYLNKPLQNSFVWMLTTITTIGIVIIATTQANTEISIPKNAYSEITQRTNEKTGIETDIKTNVNPIIIWNYILKENQTILEQIKNDNFSSEEVLLKDNKFLSNKGGIRVNTISGIDWKGEIRSVTIPKNIARGIEPYIIFGMVYSQNSETKILTEPNSKKSQEYLNLGGDWLGYSKEDTIDPPKILKK